MDRRSFLIAGAATLAVTELPALAATPLPEQVLAYPEFDHIPSEHHVASVVAPGIAAMVDKRLRKARATGLLYVRDPGRSPHVCAASECFAPGRVILGTVVGRYRVPTAPLWNLRGGRMMSGNAWIDCVGCGAPKAAGTLVQIRRFNGEVATFHIGQGQVVAADGSVIPAGNGRWSCWNYTDGGPMSVKAKSYRVIAEADVHARNAAMFNAWRTIVPASARLG